MKAIYQVCITAVLLSAVVGCGQLPMFTADTAAVARNEFRMRCDKELALAAELRKELETQLPPFTVGSVLRPYNRFSMLVSDLWMEAQLYESVHPDPAYREIAGACKLRVGAFASELALSRPLYRVLSLVDLSGANNHTQRFLALELEDFRRAGVDRSEPTRARLAQLNQEMEALKQTFERNLREDTRYMELRGVDELAGMPQDYVESHAADADGLIRISTKYPDYLPLMTYADRGDVRRRMAHVFGTRGWPANEAVFRQLLEKRQEYADLLGYDNYADLATADMMSGSGVVVAKFIDELADLAEAPALEQYQQLLTRKRRQEPGATEVHDWEKSYYAERLRRDRYRVDASEVRQYFGYADTRDAVFALTERLFGLQVRPWNNQRVWHPDVEAYELLDGQRVLGRFYLDMHPREGKHDHASHFPLQVGVANRQLPMSALVTNLPGSGNPQARLEHDDVITFAHEFGHLLHRLLSGHFEWGGLMGTEWDFVEAPAQMLEEWFWDPGFLRSFARNINGDPIPMSLVENMNRARGFGQALSVRSQLYLTAMSFYYHYYNPDSIDLDELMLAMRSQYSLFGYLDGTHAWANFGHLAGYSALYYTYLWSQVIALDMFSVFEREGLFDTTVADRYRDTILAGAGSRPAAELIEEFLGRPFNMKAFRERLLEK